eukprot:4518813-Pleurochrysis_carterae.AAC.4
MSFSGHAARASTVSMMHDMRIENANIPPREEKRNAHSLLSFTRAFVPRTMGIHTDLLNSCSGLVQASSNYDADVECKRRRCLISALSLPRWTASHLTNAKSYGFDRGDMLSRCLSAADGTNSLLVHTFGVYKESEMTEGPTPHPTTE